MDKILIAEDDADMLDFIAFSLEEYQQEHKFEILTAKNGKEAIQTLEKTSVSLLITDVRMPEIDGLALLAYVNKNHPSTPCFVMTAYKISDALRQLADDTMILHFFPKPFNIELFAREIIRVLEDKAPAGTLQGISVDSFLYMIENEKKTCRFEVTLPNNKKAIFNFNKGELYGANCGHRKGEKAAMEFIVSENANFRFLPLTSTEVPKVKKIDLSALIAKAKEHQEH